MERSWFALGLLTAVAVAMVGCGTEKNLEGTMAAGGVVTKAGAPLAGATVTFNPVSADTRAASAVTDDQGKFELTTLKGGDGAMAGDYKVTIVKTETVGKTYTPEEANAYYMQHQTQPPAPEVKNSLDKKYSQPDTSGLTATVKEGEKNSFTFEVQ